VREVLVEVEWIDFPEVLGRDVNLAV